MPTDKKGQSFEKVCYASFHFLVCPLNTFVNIQTISNRPHLIAFSGKHGI